MTNFNDVAARQPEAEQSALVGYLGFSFGEGLRMALNRKVGGLMGRQLQRRFRYGTRDEWNADCVIYTAQFNLGKALPSEEVQTNALVKFFEEQGATVLKTAVEIELDVEHMSHHTRAISIVVSLEDLKKAKEAVMQIDAACNGHFTRQYKARQPRLKV